MTIKPRENLPPPPENLEDLSDHERKISGGPVYALTEVVDYINHLDGSAFNFATEKAAHDLLVKLHWNLKDMCGFVRCLGRHHYRGSEWCYGSGKAKIAFPSDIYIMGYNRIKQIEWPQLDPWNYFKFSFSSTERTIEIFSIHPEVDK